MNEPHKEVTRLEAEIEARYRLLMGLYSKEVTRLEAEVEALKGARIIEELEDRTGREISQAAAYIALKRRDAAFELLRASLDEKSTFIADINTLLEHLHNASQQTLAEPDMWDNEEVRSILYRYRSAKRCADKRVEHPERLAQVSREEEAVDLLKRTRHIFGDQMSGSRLEDDIQEFLSR